MVEGEAPWSLWSDRDAARHVVVRGRGGGFRVLVAVFPLTGVLVTMGVVVIVMVSVAVVLVTVAMVLMTRISVFVMVSVVAAVVFTRILIAAALVTVAVVLSPPGTTGRVTSPSASAATTASNAGRRGGVVSSDIGPAPLSHLRDGLNERAV